MDIGWKEIRLTLEEARDAVKKTRLREGPTMITIKGIVINQEETLWVLSVVASALPSMEVVRRRTS